MGRLSIPISDHRAIRRDRSGEFGVRAEVARITVTIANVAQAIAGESGSPSGVGNDGYDHELVTGTDRLRGHVWANNDTTEKAERDTAPLMQAAMRVQ
ncbi:hypothetical protein PBI_LEMURIA_11 [Mycobacterium phage Lemuria]|uniref:Uncharacterized protein n=1 Tax=Mycobacterium phage Lemuria TaxID=2599868 RepID=A0A5J6TGS4_9CAUD|nr:hypothetical protein KDW76_gp11 [Mycobacterium phage Lemuria]QFG10091.1 hypothetical protein PBI_LEMURIA_11 [Mycobacterium phage Lemuria]